MVAIAFISSGGVIKPAVVKSGGLVTFDTLPDDCPDAFTISKLSKDEIMDVATRGNYAGAFDKQKKDEMVERLTRNWSAILRNVRRGFAPPPRSAIARASDEPAEGATEGDTEGRALVFVRQGGILVPALVTTGGIIDAETIESDFGWERSMDNLKELSKSDLVTLLGRFEDSVHDEQKEKEREKLSHDALVKKVYDAFSEGLEHLTALSNTFKYGRQMGKALLDALDGDADEGDGINGEDSSDDSSLSVADYWDFDQNDADDPDDMPTYDTNDLSKKYLENWVEDGIIKVKVKDFSTNTYMFSVFAFVVTTTQDLKVEITNAINFKQCGIKHPLAPNDIVLMAGKLKKMKDEYAIGIYKGDGENVMDVGIQILQKGGGKRGSASVGVKTKDEFNTAIMEEIDMLAMRLQAVGLGSPHIESAMKKILDIKNGINAKKNVFPMLLSIIDDGMVAQLMTEVMPVSSKPLERSKKIASIIFQQDLKSLEELRTQRAKVVEALGNATHMAVVSEYGDKYCNISWEAFSQDLVKRSKETKTEEKPSE